MARRFDEHSAETAAGPSTIRSWKSCSGAGSDADRHPHRHSGHGAAGLTCSTTEMGSRGGANIEIDVSLVPQRGTA
jgi:hypothetical protein